MARGILKVSQITLCLKTDCFMLLDANLSETFFETAKAYQEMWKGVSCSSPTSSSSDESNSLVLMASH